MTATTRPKLGKLETPRTATFPSNTFPSEITSATPLSAISFTFKPDPDFLKTPISPPSAYTDFLSKAMSLNSPAIASGETTPDSLPDMEASEQSDCSYKSDRSSPTTSMSSASIKDSPPATAPIVPPSPFTASVPMSAPPGIATFPSLRLPPSPSVSHLDSPMTPNTARSPFSARSVHSVFDWDAALKARFAEKKQKQKSSRTSVRHIREVVTRTVTYTPRMAPAPKGKRRKVE